MADYRFAIKFIKPGEGSASRSKTDVASARPAPWFWQGYNDWHTVKGITYETFSTYAPVLGYPCTAEEFFNMKDETWARIFKKAFWDSISADTVTSDVIATYAVTWLWGSGVYGGRSRLAEFLHCSQLAIPTTLNMMISHNEKSLFDAMLASREQQFRKMNQPANLHGWIDRLNNYRIALTPFIKNYGKA